MSVTWPSSPDTRHTPAYNSASSVLCTCRCTQGFESSTRRGMQLEADDAAGHACFAKAPARSSSHTHVTFCSMVPLEGVCHGRGRGREEGPAAGLSTTSFNSKSKVEYAALYNWWSTTVSIHMCPGTRTMIETLLPSSSVPMDATSLSAHLPLDPRKLAWSSSNSWLLYLQCAC